MHKSLSMSIIREYHVKGPEVFEKENKLKKNLFQNSIKILTSILHYVDGKYTLVVMLLILNQIIYLIFKSNLD